MSMSYQLIEIQDSSENVLCPCCQQAVLDWAEEQYIQPCEHTLFVAMDLGFEYISDEFEQSMSRTVDELHADDDNLQMFHELTHAAYPEYLIYQADLGVENLKRYIGFTMQ